MLTPPTYNRIIFELYYPEAQSSIRRFPCMLCLNSRMWLKGYRLMSFSQTVWAWGWESSVAVRPGHAAQWTSKSAVRVPRRAFWMVPWALISKHPDLGSQVGSPSELRFCEGLFKFNKGVMCGIEWPLTQQTCMQKCIISVKSCENKNRCCCCCCFVSLEGKPFRST